MDPVRGMSFVRKIVSAAIGFAIVVSMLVPTVGAQTLDLDTVRGGWAADIDGERHIYVLKVRDSGITGIYCWDCSDPNNLSFVQNGRLESDTIRFEVFHDVGPGAPYRDEVVGRLVDNELVLTARRLGNANLPAVETTMQRESRRPANAAPLPGEAPVARGGRAEPGGGGGAPAGGGGGRGRPAYVPPGPNELLTAEKISGVWVWADGPGRQWFAFREVEGKVMGVVCGPCDNPFTFGVLDTFVIDGETMTFNIVHEDWGFAIEDGPFNNMATVTVARHEMRMRTLQENAPIRFEMTMTGPLRLD
jgi:hypothetical protein